MPYHYSVINDLYGVEVTRRKSEHNGLFWLVIVMILASTFFLVSVRPVMRLRNTPPSDFLVGTSKANATSVRGQEHIGRSYWGLATEFVSREYSFGDSLPDSPPRDFTDASGNDATTRDLYWRRLRRVWNEPGVWARSYQLDTRWIYSLLGSLGRVVKYNA